jgi:hypothetical protein
VDFPEPRPFLLLFHHLHDQLDHVGVAGHLDVAGLGRFAVALQRPLLGQGVELGPVDFDQHPLILREFLADLRPRQLDPVELNVVFGFQLQPEDQLQFRQGRDFSLEALDRGTDQIRSRGGHLVMLAEHPVTSLP